MANVLMDIKDSLVNRMRKGETIDVKMFMRANEVIIIEVQK